MMMAEKKSGISTTDDQGGGSCELRAWILCFVFVMPSVVLIVLMKVSVFSPFGLFMRPTSVLEYYSIPKVELQTKIISAASKNQFRAVSSDQPLPNSSSIPINHRPPYPTVLREDQKLEQGLSRARAAIRKAASLGNISASFSSTFGNIYRNAAAFHRSYMEMEKRFKVYVYKEGELPMVHYGPCKNIYASEGRFIHEMEYGGNRFRTGDPHLAHVFFMPFSVTWMVKYIYKPNSHDVKPLQEFVSDYVMVISTKHPFWNQTQGADHFMLSCHDWGPHASRGNSLLYNRSIRVLCNANSSEGFNPRKDVSLPEIHLYDGDISRNLRSLPPANGSRPYLAFFAGGLHGPIRPILLQHWKGRDTDLRVYEYLPKGLDYYTFMLQSRFCLCPSGHEVASPRIVEAIYAECIPVILSDRYVLPFSDVLSWEAFSIQVEISEIPRLKEVLMAIPDEKYKKLKEGLRAVRKHFVLNEPAQKFDAFHMILHSVWLRRLNLRLR